MSEAFDRTETPVIRQDMLKARRDVAVTTGPTLGLATPPQHDDQHESYGGALDGVY